MPQRFNPWKKESGHHDKTPNETHEPELLGFGAHVGDAVIEHIVSAPDEPGDVPNKKPPRQSSKNHQREMDGRSDEWSDPKVGSCCGQFATGR